MKPTTKYWVFILGIALSIMLVIGFSFVASWGNLAPEEQSYVESLIGRLVPFPVFGGMVIFIIIGGMVSLLFRFYIIPILQLSEEARLISSVNARHRIEPRGASEVQQLITIINESAEAYEKLQTDVDERIADSKSALDAERNRLAALMSELPSGVLVCNTDGQIMLYNPQSQKLLADDDDGSRRHLGLGRSIFGHLERNPILHGLDVLQQSLNSGQRYPTTGFLMPLGERYLRVTMAPVTEKREDDNLELTGFVLTLEDMAPQIEADSRRESWLQTLTDELQDSVGRIRESISTILSTPDMTRDDLTARRKVIDDESKSMMDRLEKTREQAARYIRSTSGRNEEVLCRDLLEVTSRHLQSRFGLTVETAAQFNAWIKLDSYIAVQGIAFLAGRLKKRSRIELVTLQMTQLDDRVTLVMSWEKDRVPLEDVSSWQETPLVTDRLQHTFSFRDYIHQCHGDLAIDTDSGEYCNHVSITLPATRAEESFSGGSHFEHRPVFYDFDLFHSRDVERMRDIPLRKLTFVAFDSETTGLDPNNDEIIQIGGIRVVNCKPLSNETFDQLVDPQRQVPELASRITGITPDMLVGQPTVDKVLPRFHDFVEGAVLVAHNAAFDMRFLQLKEIKSGVKFHNPVLCTLLLSTVVQPNQKDHTLDTIASRFDIPIVGRHTALGDSIVTADVLIKLIPLLESQGIHTLGEAIKASAQSEFASHSF